MTNTEPIAKLKAAMLASQTLGELYALMEDYSYEEFMQVYNQLTPKQQAEIDAICDRDTKMQMIQLTPSELQSLKKRHS
jgi:outer membrane lipoprotein-sorting protein